MSAEPTPRREVVTGQPRRVRPLPRYRTQAEIDEQTALGGAYVRSLMRGQLRAGLTVFAVLALVAGTLPLLFAALDSSALVWGVLGFAAYPPLTLAAWWYVRRAERNERDFARLVEAAPHRERPRPHGVLGGGRPRRPRHRPGRRLRPAHLPYDLRLLRRLPHRAPRLNAAAISGEYLSAASFLGVAGLVLVHGPDMLWYPVGYTAGYLVLLVFVAAPLRRSGAYTLPDFAEGRLESRQVRRLVSALVVGAGWLYLVPQLQGAGLTLKILTGAPGWLGDVLVATVVTAAVAAGGMRSITFVQVFQYWLKLTALLVPALFLVLAWQGDGRPGSASTSNSPSSAPTTRSTPPTG